MDKHNQSNQTKGLRYTQTKLNDIDIHNQTEGYGYTQPIRWAYMRLQHYIHVEG